MKQPILCNAGSDKDCKYKVNFNPNLRVIIREAKFLDRIGMVIPPTIVNIALQDKEYMMQIDGLNKLLRSYNSAIGELRAVEKKLLFKDINKLNVKMNKGLENHNWFSLSISEYIEECNKEIEKFKDTLVFDEIAISFVIRSYSIRQKHCPKVTRRHPGRWPHQQY